MDYRESKGIDTPQELRFRVSYNCQCQYEIGYTGVVVSVRTGVHTGNVSDSWLPTVMKFIGTVSFDTYGYAHKFPPRWIAEKLAEFNGDLVGARFAEGGYDRVEYDGEAPAPPVAYGTPYDCGNGRMSQTYESAGYARLRASLRAA